MAITILVLARRTNSKSPKTQQEIGTTPNMRFCIFKRWANELTSYFCRCVIETPVEYRGSNIHAVQSICGQFAVNIGAHPSDPTRLCALTLEHATVDYPSSLNSFCLNVKYNTPKTLKPGKTLTIKEMNQNYGIKAHWIELATLHALDNATLIQLLV
jgi:hypothetical protein